MEKIDREMAALPAFSSLELPQLVPACQYLSPRVVWRIPVPGQPDVFMCLPEHYAPSDFVIYVVGLAFYRVWLNLDWRHVRSCGLRSDMVNDFKFQKAVNGFAEGLDNPVPLAGVTLMASSLDGCGLAMDVVDGVTRLKWLLANQVEVFPVHCSVRNMDDCIFASFLANRAGAGIASVFYVADLMAEAERLSFIRRHE